MGIPTSEELDQALKAAATMRESDKDYDHIAKSLLSLNYRFEKSVKVIELLKIYFHSGASGTEHAKLIKAIQEFEKAQGVDKRLEFGLE